jgi:peptide alpha-N-acetyltransferase
MGSKQVLPSKEQSLFKTVLVIHKLIQKHYEAKEYKKGIKMVDQILKKVPDHGGISY